MSRPTFVTALDAAPFAPTTARFAPAAAPPRLLPARVRTMELTLELLIIRVSRGDYWERGFQIAAKLMAALPVATNVYASTRGHLTNASAYCRAGEYGAAAFELRMLRGLVRQF